MDIQIAVAIAIGALAIIVGLLTLREISILRTTATGQKPGVSEVLDALQKYVYIGIIGGEKLVLQGEQGLDSALTSADKAKIANSIYNILPDVLMVGTVPVPLSLVKTLITPAAFATAVKSAYDEAHALLLRNETYLAQQINAIVPLPPLPVPVPLQPPTIVPTPGSVG